MPTREQRKSTIKAIEFLTASGIENGWQICPGWYAPLCDDYVNNCIENYEKSGIEKKKDGGSSEYDKFAEEIYDIRHRAIMLINRILDKPLISGSDKSDDPLVCVHDAVYNLLANNDGSRLINLLCPMQDVANNRVDTPNTSYVGSDNILKLESKFFEKLILLNGYKDCYIH